MESCYSPIEKNHITDEVNPNTGLNLNFVNCAVRIPLDMITATITSTCIKNTFRVITLNLHFYFLVCIDLFKMQNKTNKSMKKNHFTLTRVAVITKLIIIYSLSMLFETKSQVLTACV